MKTKLLLNFLLFAFSFLLCPAQTPQGFNYQAIARDGSGNPIVGATIKVKLSILTDTAGFRATGGGVYLWEEEHLNVTTNAFGLFNIVLGDPGATQCGGSAASFSLINWSLPDLYIGTKIANPTTYKFLGAAKLWSVPYALRAKDSDQWLVNGADIYRSTGKVGIGTSTPLVPLSVYNPGSNTTIHIGGTAAGLTYLSAGTSDNTNGYSYLQSVKTAGTAYGDLIFNSSGGNIGIGTITPTALFNPYKSIGDGLNNTSEIMNLTIKPTFSTHLLRFYGTRKVAGTSWNDVSLRIQQRVDATDMGYIEFNPGSGAQDLAFGTSNTERLRISGAGNVGIGTNNPLALLHVTGDTRLNHSMVGDGIELMAYSTGNRYSGIDFHSDDTYGDFALRILRENTGPNANSLIIHRGLGELVLWTQDAAPITMSTTSVERFRITPTGNVGIGTVTPGQKLTVAGSFSATTSSFTSMEIGGPAPSPTNGQATLYLHHHSNIAHQLRYASGRLVLEAAGNGYGTNATPEFQVNGSLFAAINGGNVGIGTTTPTSKMTINPPATWDDNVPLFEVKNKYGTPVLAVYNNGVRILVAHDATAKGVTKGGFAIGGFDYSKAFGETVNLMSVAPDSIRFNIDNDNTKGITKGGFAIGSFDVTKGINVNPKEFMNMTPLGSTTGQFNTFLGYQAGSKNKTGKYNVYLGYQAGYNGTSGEKNYLIGYQAGYNNNSISNVFLGDSTGFYNTTGGFNVFLGNQSGLKNTSGGGNVLVGQWAGRNQTSAAGNSIIGAFAGYINTTGTVNTFIGFRAGEQTKSGNSNILIGESSGANSVTPLKEGTGSYNILIGSKAGASYLTGTGNISIGRNSSYSLSSGINNVSIGNFSHATNSIGSGNTSIGYRAGNKALGDYNVFIGYDAGFNETGANKLYIANSSTNMLVYGDFASNYVVIAGNNPNSMTFFVNGSAGGWSAWTNVSDVRFKKDIVTIPDALSKVRQMRGVNFNWKDSLAFEKDKQIGFIAQEVEKILPEVVSKDAKSGRLFLEYAPITALLVEAMKEQQLQIESQQKQIESTKEENQLLKSQLQSLQEKMERIEAMLMKGGVK